MLCPAHAQIENGWFLSLGAKSPFYLQNVYSTVEMQVNSLTLWDYLKG